MKIFDIKHPVYTPGTWMMDGYYGGGYEKPSIIDTRDDVENAIDLRKHKKEK